MSLPITDPGDLIAAIPAMLGFTPHRSLVFALVAANPKQTGSQTVWCVARTDLPPPGQPAGFAIIAGQVARLCLDPRTAGIIVVFVDDTKTTAGSGRDAEFLAYIRHLSALFDERGIDIAGLVVPRIAAGAVWRSVIDPLWSGILPDPTTSTVAARRGQHLTLGADKATHHLQVDHILRGRVSAEMREAGSDAARRLGRAVQIGNIDDYTRRALWLVMQTVTASSEQQPTPRALAEVAVALRTNEVRDVMFAVALGVHAQTAERLWLLLTRALPDPDRAQAATLLAYSAYLRGDGILAGAALRVAIDSDPEYRMAMLLDIALTHACPPDRLTRVARSAVETATGLRIDIGVTGNNQEKPQ